VRDGKIVVLDLKQQKHFYTYNPSSFVMTKSTNDEAFAPYFNDAVDYYQSACYLFKNGLMKESR
jgi:hypothetical protein